MAESATLTVRIDPVTKEKLQALARDTKRSKSFLAAEAITAYVQNEAWQIEQIKAGIADADAGRLIPHAQIKEWIASLGTANELPPPKWE